MDIKISKHKIIEVEGKGKGKSLIHGPMKNGRRDASQIGYIPLFFWEYREASLQ